MTGITGRSRRSGAWVAYEEVDREESTTGDEAGFLVGVVTAGGAIRHVAAHPCAVGLATRLADYASDRAFWQLGPEGAGRVRQHVREGRTAEAVAHYFSHAGNGPEGERLTVLRLGPTGLSPAGIAFPGVEPPLPA